MDPYQTPPQSPPHANPQPPPAPRKLTDIERYRRDRRLELEINNPTMAIPLINQIVEAEIQLYFL